MNGLLRKAVTFKSILLSVSAGGLLLVSMPAVSQWCNISLFASSPTHSFTVNSLGTALDRKTNLEWKVCAEGQIWSLGDCIGSASFHNWQQALDVPNALNASEGYAGKSDWRLPNIKELATIMEHRCSFPSINQAVFFEYNEDEALYWSASPDKKNEALSWALDFSYEFLHRYQRWQTLQVRLVRTVPKAS